MSMRMPLLPWTVQPTAPRAPSHEPSRPHRGGDLFSAPDRWLATPLLVALLFIEMSGVIVIVDSVPAIFAISREPFIVFTSNVFAILGLRAMYFHLA